VASILEPVLEDPLPKTGSESVDFAVMVQEIQAPFTDESWRMMSVRAREYVTFLDSEYQVLYVNRGIGSRPDWLGRSAFDYVRPEYHEILRNSVERARQTRTPQHFESEAPSDSRPVALYSNWVIALEHPERATPIVAFIANDVTHLSELEHALARSEETRRAVVTHATDYIAIMRADGTVAYENHPFPGLLAHHQRDPSRLSEPNAVPHRIAPLHRSQLDEAIRRACDDLGPCSFETRFAVGDDERDFLIRLNPVLHDGSIREFVLIATDITAQRAAELEQQRLTAQLHHAQKLRALGQLTGGVAHDFNNLLMVIAGSIEAARLAPSREEARPELERALRSAERAAELTRHLLSVSRRQELDPRPIDVAALVARMRDLLQRMLGETIEVVAVDEAVAPICLVDAAQLESAILHLAVNARDAMPEGGRLTLHTSNPKPVTPAQGRHEGGARRQLRLRVSDTGEGMSREVLSHALDPFFTTKDVGAGSGLGLSIAHGFVQQSGGELQIFSEPARGTTVEVLLPCHETGPSDRALP